MKKQPIVIISLFLLLLAIALATLDDYVDNLDNSFYDGTLNVTSISDVMADSDSNSQNDTLMFTITTDYATSDTFTANIIFDDESLPVLSDARAISGANPSFY